MKKQINDLAINPSTAIKSSTEVGCPNSDCDSKLFLPTIRVRKVSALLTENGKPGAFTLAGPLLCAQCKRELSDADFGYINNASENKPEDADEKESSE